MKIIHILAKIMKRKYRIRETNGKFYPQYKIFLFWDYFIEYGYIVYYNTKYYESWMHSDKFVKWSFDNIDDAKKFIEKEKEKINKRKVIYHPIQD